MTIDPINSKIDKIGDKIDAMTGDVTETRITIARIYENLNHHKETLDIHSKKHEDMSKHVSNMESHFNDKIHEQIKSAKYMGYMGTMIGSVITFIAVKLPQILPKLFQ